MAVRRKDRTHTMTLFTRKSLAAPLAALSLSLGAAVLAAAPVQAGGFKPIDPGIGNGKPGHGHGHGHGLGHGPGPGRRGHGWGWGGYGGYGVVVTGPESYGEEEACYTIRRRVFVPGYGRIWKRVQVCE